MKKSKAKIMLENLTKNRVLQHKKEKDFYIEYDEGGHFILNRNGKIIAVDDRVEFVEAIIKHHDTRNWQMVESPFTKRHPLLSIIL